MDDSTADPLLRRKSSSTPHASATTKDGSKWVSLSIHNVDQAVDQQSLADAKRKMQGRYKAALLLRRRVGSLREDRDFDELMRQKSIHILFFSMIGLVVAVATQLVVWLVSSKPGVNKDAYVSSGKNGDTPVDLVNTLYIAQSTISASTICAVALISQQYRLIIMAKRAEWSGSNLFEVEALRGGAATNSLMRDRFENSYVFSRSPLRWKFVAEVMVHLPHPIIWMASPTNKASQEIVRPTIGFIPDNVGYKFLQIVLFLRLYLLPNIVHIHSEAYISRFEVVNSDADLLAVSYRIEPTLTLKMLFYQYTMTVLLSSIVISALIFGFALFTFERVEGTFDPHASDPGFGSYWVAIWFSYITFSTVGYGEYFPLGNIARLIACCNAIVGVGVFTLFGAVLVSRVALSKEQKHSVEYLATRGADETYREAAQNLIMSAFVKFIAPHCARPLESVGNTTGHKSNRLHKAIKDFRSARRDLEGSFAQADDVVFSMKLGACASLAEAMEREAMDFINMQMEIEENLVTRLRAILATTNKGIVAGKIPV